MNSAIYEAELAEKFLNKRVKHSQYSLRSLWDAYLSAGTPARKISYRVQYDKKLAERGTVVEILEANHDIGSASGLRIEWDNGMVSKCLPYMVDVAEENSE